MLRRGLIPTIALIAVLASAPPAAGHVTVTRAPVVAIADGQAVTGASGLVRSHRGIGAVVATGSLVPGDAYTVWAVIFNNPDACADDCDAADLADPDVGGASVLGAGKVVRAARSMFMIRMGADAELTNPEGAEIHFVVRTHGPALDGLVDEQISTLNGGCPPNTCSNVLVSIHR